MVQYQISITLPKTPCDLGSSLSHASKRNACTARPWERKKMQTLFPTTASHLCFVGGLGPGAQNCGDTRTNAMQSYCVCWAACWSVLVSIIIAIALCCTSIDNQTKQTNICNSMQLPMSASWLTNNQTKVDYFSSVQLACFCRSLAQIANLQLGPI